MLPLTSFFFNTSSLAAKIMPFTNARSVASNYKFEVDKYD